jgi:hypothetical protein
MKYLILLLYLVGLRRLLLLVLVLMCVAIAQRNPMPWAQPRGTSTPASGDSVAAAAQQRR